MADIAVRAGSRVFEMIQAGAFHFDRVTSYVGPAVGPRWLIAAGFDKTFLGNDLLGRQRPVVLAGSSAGALRFAAWLQPGALESYERLVDGYIHMSFDRDVTPRIVLDSVKAVIDGYIEDDAVPFALAHKRYRLAVTTARARNLAASEIDWIQRIGLGCGFLANGLHAAWLNMFFRRVVFFSGPMPPRFCCREGFTGKTVPLNVANFRHALLASSAIPLVVSGVRDIFGAPNGVYRDGGLMDYHLNQRYAEKGDEVVLLFHHQERIVPGWLDKRLRYREAAPDFIENVLMVQPTAEFIAKLPGGKIPDRDDFAHYVDDPGLRIRNWRRAAALADSLGEQFLELMASDRIRAVVQKM